MTKTAIIFLLLSSPAFAAEDCQKSVEACSAGTKTLSPFVAASIGERLPPPALPGGKKAALRESPDPRPAAAEIVSGKEEGPSKDGPEAAPQPDAEPSGEAPEEEGSAGGLSVKNPFWLVFMGSLLAGIYLYLGGDARKGGKK